MTKMSDGLSQQDLAHLKSAIDEAAIVAITDKRGVITYVNKKFCAISQYSSEELIGQTHQIINSQFHPPQFFAHMWSTISSGQTWEGEIRNRAKDGSFYWVHTTIVPFLDANGNPERYVAVRYEITERKLAEEQLQIYAKKLEVSNQEILQQDRLASLGLLASSLAHEIGTPLGIIRSRAEMAEKKVTENETLKRDMGIIVSQIDRIAKLVNSLLNLAREKKSDFGAAVDLNLVIQDVLGLLQHEFDRKGIAFRAELTTRLKVKAESGPLGQVLINLLINAVHAVDEAKKSRRGDPYEIVLSAKDGGERIEICVDDTGVGISEENLRHLFKPFFTTKDIGQGTGLGLATSMGIVNSWGGEIAASSRLGSGSKFRILLPKF